VIVASIMTGKPARRRVTGRRDLAWRRDGDGWVLCHHGAPMLRVVSDTRPGLWRVEDAYGHLSDRANLTWTKHAAMTTALAILNEMQGTAAAAPPIADSSPADPLEPPAAARSSEASAADSFHLQGGSAMTARHPRSEVGLRSRKTAQARPRRHRSTKAETEARYPNFKKSSLELACSFAPQSFKFAREDRALFRTIEGLQPAAARLRLYQRRRHHLHARRGTVVSAWHAKQAEAV
jgi:hypothetical protein